MTYEIPRYDDHSLKGYLQRQATEFLRGELGRLLLRETKEALSDYDLSCKAMLTEILQQRGESTDIDLSTVIYPLSTDPCTFLLTDR